MDNFSKLTDAVHEMVYSYAQGDVKKTQHQKEKEGGRISSVEKTGRNQVICQSDFLPERR